MNLPISDRNIASVVTGICTKQRCFRDCPPEGSILLTWVLARRSILLTFRNERLPNSIQFHRRIKPATLLAVIRFRISGQSSPVTIVGTEFRLTAYLRATRSRVPSVTPRIARLLINAFRSLLRFCRKLASRDAIHCRLVFAERVLSNVLSGSTSGQVNYRHQIGIQMA